MSWLTINGIEMRSLASLQGGVTGAVRDIGAQADAVDGSIVATRQTEKRDLTLQSVPLSGDDGFALEGLLRGTAHVWSFNSSPYSSKGLGPTLGSVGVSAIQATHKKYGAGALHITPGEDWITDPVGAFPLQNTVSVWAALESDPDAFHHYVLRSDGTVWTDGVLGDPFSVGPGADAVFIVSDGQLRIDCDMTTQRTYIDDLVVCPYLWPDDWAAQVYAAGVPFGLAPYLTAAGDLVKEAASRKMVCSSCREKVIVASLPGLGLTRDVRTVEFELKGA